jgi:hypothetical protein
MAPVASVVSTTPLSAQASNTDCLVCNGAQRAEFTFRIGHDDSVAWWSALVSLREALDYIDPRHDLAKYLLPVPVL